MTNYDNTSGAGTLRLTVTQTSQNIGANQSTVNWQLHLICGNGVSFNNSPIVWSVLINGTNYSGTYTFNFGSYSDKLIASGSTVITHNADGTKTASVAGHTDHTGTSAIGGPIDVSGSFPLTRIPRGPKVENAGAWQQTICYVEVGGAWQTALCYVEQGGAWVLAA